MNQIVFGNYLLTRRIGTGGMAEVFLAKRLTAANTDKSLALKKLLDKHKNDEEVVRLFLNEGRLMSYIMHPNVIEVYDVGEVENTPYLVMEYIFGKDLYSVIRNISTLGISIPLDIIFYIINEILEGLHIIHSARDNKGHELNIIHGDINPSNIFISFNGEVKIGDFGIAKSKFDQKKKSGNILKGKISYLAPEQIMLENFNHQIDIYDAGLILLEMLTLKKAFDETTDERLLLEILNKEIDTIVYNNKEIDENLKKIILKAINKNPKNRYRSAQEFQKDIQEYIAKRGIRLNYIMLRNFMHSLYEEQLENEQLITQQEVSNYSGSISVTPLPKIFIQIINEKKTGRLYVENSGIYKNIYFKNGKIYYVSSNYQPEFIGEFIAKKGILSKELIAEVLDICKTENIRFIDYLVTKQIIKPHEMYNMLVEQIKEKIYHLFSWDKGNFIYFDKEITRQEALPLSLGDFEFIYRCINQFTPTYIIENYLSNFIFQPISINPDAREYIEMTRFNAYELRLVKIISQQKNLNEAINEAVLTYNYKKDEVLKVFFMLEIIGYLKHN
ncbi:MAG: protein kinase domain-containing protein [Myxococcota bacterium]